MLTGTEQFSRDDHEVHFHGVLLSVFAALRPSISRENSGLGACMFAAVTRTSSGRAEIPFIIRDVTYCRQIDVEL
jgi:hypothetical protein